MAQAGTPGALIPVQGILLDAQRRPITGQPVVARFAVKPTSSILSPRRTVDRSGADTEIMTRGRHDPCVGIRAVPVGEAMMACVLADHFLRHRGQVGAPPRQ